MQTICMKIEQPKPSSFYMYIKTLKTSTTTVTIQGPFSHACVVYLMQGKLTPATRHCIQWVLCARINMVGFSACNCLSVASAWIRV